MLELGEGIIHSYTFTTQIFSARADISHINTPVSNFLPSIFSVVHELTSGI